MAENGGTVAKKIISISINIQGYWERINFDVIKTSTYDAVLRLPWLAQHNPTINYKNRTIVFDGCDYQPTKNIDIEEVLVRVINAYYK